MSRRKRMLDDLDQDIREHLDRETQDNVARGMSPEEARYAALRKFGNVMRVKQETREAWGWTWLERLVEDLRFGLRMLGKNPGFTVVAVLTLALGIGATTAMFAVVNAVLLRPLPYRDADRLMTLWVTVPALNYSGMGQLCDPDYDIWSSQNKAFSDTAGFLQTTADLTGLGEPEQLKGADLTASFFPTLGAWAATGRTFSAEEEKNQAALVLLSHRLAVARFGGDENALGKVVTLDGKSYTVTGVMPARFAFPSAVDFWRPHVPVEGCHNTDLAVIARLAPGISLEAARADVTRLAEVMKAEHGGAQGGSGGGWVDRIDIVPLKDMMVSNVRTLLLILLAGVTLVVLIACANVASMLLARGATRQREIAIRRALGAGRWRLIFQMLTESLLLATLGGSAGLLIARWGRSLIVMLMPALFGSPGAPGSSAQLGNVSMDAKVFLFAAALSIGTSLLFGLAPALQALHVKPGGSLKPFAPTATSGTTARNLRGAIVIAEVALTIVLLTSAGLLLKSFVRLSSVQPGFNPTNLLTFNVMLPDAKYPTAASMDRFHEAMLTRLHEVPGALSAATVMGLPISDNGIRGDLTVEGQTLPQGFVVNKLVVSTDYFRTMGIPLRMGREFDERDSAHASPVLVVSQSFADQVWPNEKPIGRRANPGFSGSPLYSVAGVVGDVSQNGLAKNAPPTIYMVYSQAPASFLMQMMAVVVRTGIPPSSVARSAQAAVEAVDRDLPIFEVRSMEQLIYESEAEPRFNSGILGCFAGLALLLAAVGIYGVLAYNVNQRTNEIGIRRAVGAESKQVLRLVLADGAKLTIPGVAIGLLASLAASRVLASYLFGVTPTDPAVFAGVTLLSMCVAMVACCVPAHRAVRVDPMIALRHEE